MNSNSYAKLFDELSELSRVENKELEVLSCREERALFLLGDRVVKAHCLTTDEAGLNQRLAVIAAEPWRKIFLSPLRPLSQRARNGRLLTYWPKGSPLHLSSESIPWGEAGRLLAKLHKISVAAAEPSLPRPLARAIIRWENAIASLDDVRDERRGNEWKVVCEAAAKIEIPSFLFAKSHWIHGDFHLGQMVAISKNGKNVWRLIDIEDMGLSHAVWDLARPAAFYLAGLLDPYEWQIFIGTYLEAGGTAFFGDDDIWQKLGPSALCLTIQCAAVALTKAQRENRDLNCEEKAFIASCERYVYNKKLLEKTI